MILIRVRFFIMENRLNVINLAPRVTGEKSKSKRLSSLGVSALVLVSDLGWFLYRRSTSNAVLWWEILFIVISSIFVLFSLLGLMFTASNNKFSQRVADEPLIAYDNDKMVFIVQSFIEMKEKEFDRNIVNSVKINPETDEATLNYLKNDKEQSLVIGYADYHLEKEINNSIAKYKNN